MSSGPVGDVVVYAHGERGWVSGRPFPRSFRSDTTSMSWYIFTPSKYTLPVIRLPSTRSFMRFRVFKELTSTSGRTYEGGYLVRSDVHIHIVQGLEVVVVQVKVFYTEFVFGFHFQVPFPFILLLRAEAMKFTNSTITIKTLPGSKPMFSAVEVPRPQACTCVWQASSERPSGSRLDCSTRLVPLVNMRAALSIILPIDRMIPDRIPGIAVQAYHFHDGSPFWLRRAHSFPRKRLAWAQCLTLPRL